MKITETYDDFLNEKGKKPSTKSKVKKITKKIAKVVGKKEDLVKTAKEMAKSPDPSGKMQASLAKVQLKQSDAEAEKLVLQRHVEVLKSKISTAKEKEKAAKELEKTNKTNEGMLRVKLYEEFINESDERDWNDKRRGPHPYDSGLDSEEEEDKEDQMKDQAKMDDDDPDAYKEMPGDKKAREKGKFKTSKHVKSYHELYGDEENESVVTEAKNTIGLAFKDEDDYTGFVEFIKDEKGSIKKDFGWDSKTKSWEVIMDVKVLDSIYGEVTPGNKESGWYGALPGDFESVIIESQVTEAKDMTFTDYLKVLDAKFEDAMAAVKGENGSDAEITPTRGDILQNFTLFRNYVSSLTKKYKGDKTKLRFLTEKVREYESVINESVVNEEKAEGDRGPIDNPDIETALKKKQEETGVPLDFLRIVMRRGMAAWKTGHRPGAGQEQWGYARVNSFLTKQEGTWGGADSDVAKEVRDGG